MTEPSTDHNGFGTTRTHESFAALPVRWEGWALYRFVVSKSHITDLR